MINVAIVEDDIEAQKKLKAFLQRYQEFQDAEFRVTCFSNGLDFLDEYKPTFDIIFMDILMPHMDGMETAKKLRRVDDKVSIIFITTMAQYAIRGYEVGAIDFIVKPVTYQNFAAKLKKALSKLPKDKEKKIWINVDGILKYVSAKDLTYVEVVGHNLSFHLASGEVMTTRGKLAAVEESLLEENFYMIHKSLLVNLDYVKEVKQNSVIVHKDELTLSRARKKDFMQRLADFLGGIA